jgi:hypothetical protein
MSPLGTSTTTGLLYQLRILDDDGCGAVGEMRIDTKKLEYSEKTCPSTT